MNQSSFSENSTCESQIRFTYLSISILPSAFSMPKIVFSTSSRDKRSPETTNSKKVLPDRRNFRIFTDMHK